MKLKTQILLAFCIVLFLSILDTASNYLLSLQVKENTEFRNKSQEIIRTSGSLHKLIIEMHNSFRGFLLTRDSSFLGTYKAGIQNVPVILSNQKELVVGHGSQLVLLDSIESFHHNWLLSADSLIRFRNETEVDRSSDSVHHKLIETQFKKQYGKQLSDAIAMKFMQFDKEEYDLRRVKGQQLDSSIQRTHTISFALFFLTILVGIGSTIFIISIISKRIRTMVDLAENISKGKFTRVDDQSKDELTSLSASLNIMSDKLEKNIRELENRNAELDKFAYVVSHDLKAPLRGIHNAINWIEEDYGQELSLDLRKYFSIIPQRLKRMDDLINGLLDYARIREKTVPEKISVKELVGEIIETIVPANFKVQINNLPEITTERLKLQQVFTNLISNAVKYTPGDHPHIIISARELPAYYEFFVEDNGIGIESEYHEKVFDIFQTLRERDEKESTGIGLAIVKKILDDQNCNIRIVPGSGSGSTFVFTWPKANNY